MVLIEENGDLLDYNNPNMVVAHQTNCITITSYGLSKTLFTAYPYADIYTCRTRIGNRNISIRDDRGVLGTCVLKLRPDINGGFATGPIVANLMGQITPSYIGKPYPTLDFDNTPIVETQPQREQAFIDALHDMGTQLDALVLNGSSITDIYLPAYIGSGLACAPSLRNSQWKRYKRYIVSFAEQFPQYNVHIITKS